MLAGLSGVRLMLAVGVLLVDGASLLAVVVLLDAMLLALLIHPAGRARIGASPAVVDPAAGSHPVVAPLRPSRAAAAARPSSSARAGC